MNQKRSPFLRALLYIIRSLLVILFIFLFCLLCFKQASQISNITVVTIEGLTTWAETIINAGNPEKYEPEALQQYFIQGTVDNQAILKKNDYQNYIISYYDYTVQLKGVHVLPWSRRGTVEVEEIVTPINGRLNEAVENSTLPRTPPVWNEKKYKVNLVKDATGRWYIESMIEQEKEEK